jgi:hypothetical protein
MWISLRPTLVVWRLLETIVVLSRLLTLTVSTCQAAETVIPLSAHGLQRMNALIPLSNIRQLRSVTLLTQTSPISRQTILWLAGPRLISLPLRWVMLQLELTLAAPL